MDVVRRIEDAGRAASPVVGWSAIQQDCRLRFAICPYSSEAWDIL